MKMSFRWYGDSDPISLEYISQIPGMRSIVSAVYDVKPGEVWPEESLAKMKADCEAHGLVFDVVESIPVSEDIKLGTEKRDAHLEAYCENVRRCAKYGVKCVTYNFMPVFDWTRTQLDKKAADGSTSLVMYWEQMKGLDPLKDDIHLPGWDASYTQEEVRGLIQAYGELGEEGLWKNIEIFLKKVIPVAEECGVVMALHPDDPPYPIFGLPRVITCEENLDHYLSIVDSPSNTLCFCTGSLGASGNAVPPERRRGEAAHPDAPSRRACQADAEKYAGGACRSGFPLPGVGGPAACGSSVQGSGDRGCKSAGPLLHQSERQQRYGYGGKRR